MSFSIMPEGRQRYYNNDGTVAAGCKLYTYAAGTTSNKAAYQDALGTDPHPNPITLDAKGEAVIYWSGSYKIDLKTAAGAQITGYPVDNVTSSLQSADLLPSAGSGMIGFTYATAYSVGSIGRWLTDLVLGAGSSFMGFIQEGAGAVARLLQSVLRERASIFDFMTEAQIADYVARTADTDFAAALDLTLPIQTAIYTTYGQGKKLYAPPGAAKIVGTLELPTDSPLYEDRGDAWTMQGAGASQNFVRTGFSGTAFISKTDGPILRYHQRRAMPTSGANWEVKGIRFEQLNPLAAQPVVLLDSLCEYARFHHNQVYQEGVGGGIKVSCQVKGEMHHNFVMNRDWLVAPGTRYGIGIEIVSGWDSGLLTLKKNTERGFLWGLVIGDGTNDSSGTLIQQNECSNCTNGIWVKPNTTACTIKIAYMEGVTGTCLLDQGTMTDVAGGIFYLGFAVGIDSTALTYGNRYTGVYLETSGSVPCTLIDLTSDSVNGGPAKTVTGNHLLFSTSGGVVPGVRGIRINGADPRIDFHGNAFLPRGPWVGGANTIKIDDQSTGNGIYGFSTVANGNREFPNLSQGAVSFGLGSTITEADVVANTLNLSQGSFFDVTASVATSVNIVAGGNADNRLIVLHSTNANMTFNKTGQLLLNAAFTGPGMLVLLTRNIGATKYAYEVTRALH